MVIKNQLTVVCFVSGHSSALSPCLSWVKTLEQIRDICSKHAIALPHSPQGTTPRDVFLPQCSLKIFLNTWFLAVTTLLKIGTFNEIPAMEL